MISFSEDVKQTAIFFGIVIALFLMVKVWKWAHWTLKHRYSWWVRVFIPSYFSGYLRQIPRWERRARRRELRAWWIRNRHGVQAELPDRIYERWQGPYL